MVVMPTLELAQDISYRRLTSIDDRAMFIQRQPRQWIAQLACTPAQCALLTPAVKQHQLLPINVDTDKQYTMQTIDIFSNRQQAYTYVNNLYHEYGVKPIVKKCRLEKPYYTVTDSSDGLQICRTDNGQWKVYANEMITFIISQLLQQYPPNGLSGNVHYDYYAGWSMTQRTALTHAFTAEVTGEVFHTRQAAIDYLQQWFAYALTLA